MTRFNNVCKVTETCKSPSRKVPTRPRELANLEHDGTGHLLTSVLNNHRTPSGSTISSNLSRYGRAKLLWYVRVSCRALLENDHRIISFLVAYLAPSPLQSSPGACGSFPSPSGHLPIPDYRKVTTDVYQHGPGFSGSREIKNPSLHDTPRLVFFFQLGECGTTL